MYWYEIDLKSAMPDIIKHPNKLLLTMFKVKKISKPSFEASENFHQMSDITKD